MVLPHLAMEKRRVNVWEINLPRAFEIALRAVEVLRHHAEIDMIRAENVPDLPQHLLHAHVAAGVARSVVTRKQQFQFFARSPALAKAQHPAEAGDLDQRADPRDQ